MPSPAELHPDRAIAGNKAERAAKEALSNPSVVEQLRAGRERAMRARPQTAAAAAAAEIAAGRCPRRVR